MQGSGFENAPVTQLLVVYTILSAVIANLANAKYSFYFYLSPGSLWTRQFLWKLLTWQTSYANATEVIFSAMTFYNLRVVERLWGSRKFASFAIFSFLYTTTLIPLLATVVRPLFLGYLQYIPSGPTPILFALLAQYQAAIPFIYKYNIGISPQAGNSILSFTDKSTSYLLPLQLALSQFPASFVPALVGWSIGMAYRRELLPGYSWRLPSRLFGSSSSRAAEQVESLRTRMEREVQGLASGVEDLSGASDSLRRR